MSEMVKVVVDAMGGDNAPEEPVKAAVEAVKEKLKDPKYKDITLKQSLWIAMSQAIAAAFPGVSSRLRNLRSWLSRKRKIPLL